MTSGFGKATRCSSQCAASAFECIGKRSASPSPVRTVSPSKGSSPMTGTSAFYGDGPTSYAFPSFLARAEPVDGDPVDPVMVFTFFVLCIFVTGM